MNAGSYNAGLSVAERVTNFSNPAASNSTPSSSAPPSQQALQALLAFSSLHQQIRSRRDGQRQEAGAELWEIEDFVLDEVIQLVAERAQHITGADGVAIALAAGNAIVCRGSAGNMSPDPGARLDPGSGFSGACLRGAQVIRCDDTECDARVNVAASRSLGARSIVAVPIAGAHGVIGLIEAFSVDAFGFNDSDVSSLKLLAELILAALKPAEEDRMAEISRQVIEQTRDEPASHPAHESEVLQSLIAASSMEGFSAGRRPGLSLVLSCTVVALLLGGGLWWRIHQHSSGSGSADLPGHSISEPGSGGSNPQPVSPLPAESNAGPASSAYSAQQITGIRTVSSNNSSTVFIDLLGQIQYEAHRLSNPERIYLDFPDTTLATGLFGKIIETGDSRVVRVRVAQPTRGVSRVVLETRYIAEFSVRMESNPACLVIEVRDTPVAPAATLNNPAAPLRSTETTTGIQPGGTLSPVVPRLRIVLDAGHGGWDLGTVGRKGLREKEVVLDVVSRLGKLVQRRLQAEVIYTRANDNYLSLEKRAEIANLRQADLFVSVHANYSSDSSARGVETYYSNTYSSVRARTTEAADDAELQDVNWTKVDIRAKVQESRRFAAAVQQALYGTLSANIPGTRNRGVKEAAYVVLTGTTMPAILSEISFVSSPEDETRLQDQQYRQEIADALFRGIQHYTANAHKTTLAVASGPPSGH